MIGWTIGSPGPLELLVVLALGTGGGLPLGLPPAAEDPVMSRVAPEQCVFYLSWAATATPDPASKNQTEQLLAEKEVRQFIVELEQGIVSSIKREAGEEEAAVLIDDVHKVVKKVLTSSAAVFISDFRMLAGEPKISGGAMVNLGDQAAELEKTLLRLQSAALGGAVKAPGKEDAWRVLPMPEEAPPIVWGVRGKYLIIGVGRGEADKILARARMEPPAWLVKTRRQLAVDRPANIVYINVADLLKTTGAIMGPEAATVIQALGLSNVRSMASVTGLDETGCVSKTLIPVDGELTGLFSLVAVEGLTKEDLAAIPKDATLAAAARFDLAKAYKQLVQTIARVEPQARDEFLREVGQAEEMLGISLSQDIFASVGNVWRVYMSPSEGGLTGLIAVIDLRDRDRLVAANQKLILGKLAQDAAERLREGRRRRGAKISQCKCDGHTIFFLNVIGNEYPFAPAWCITDKELLIAIFPQNIKAYLGRKASAGVAAGSLADVPAVAAVLAEKPAPMKVIYLNTQEVFNTFYPVLQVGAQMLCGQLQREGIDIDVSILPSAPSIARHLRPSVMAVRRTDAGVMIESRQTLPVGGGGAMTLPIGALFWAGSVRSAPMREFPTTKNMSMNNLKQIALGLHNHNAAYRGFPAAAAPKKEGQPPVNWRVLVLPFMEEMLLYREYRLDEPWDSPHNKTLISRIPEVYKAPGSKVAAQGMTNYLAVVGEDFAFSEKEKMHLALIRDGTSHTIMVVEAADAKAVPWTKPADFQPDKKDPTAGLVGLRPGGFLAALCDGSVRFVSSGIDPVALYGLFTRAGGEMVNWREIDAARRPRPPAKVAVPRRAAPPPPPPRITP